jgi:hypothetical protein
MGNPGTTLIDRGTNQVRTGVTNVQNQVRTAVTDVTRQVTDTVTIVTKQVRDSLSSIGSQGDAAGATTSSSTSTDSEKPTRRDGSARRAGMSSWMANDGSGRWPARSATLPAMLSGTCRTNA